MNQIDMKPTTAVVDHGSAAAERTGYKSAHNSQNHDCGQDAIVRTTGGRGRTDAISDIEAPKAGNHVLYCLNKSHLSISRMDQRALPPLVVACYSSPPGWLNRSQCGPIEWMWRAL